MSKANNTQSTSEEDVVIKVECPEVTIEEEDHSPTFNTARNVQSQVVIYDSHFNLWNSKATSCLISQYKKYRSMVGQTSRFKSLRDMFDTISMEMQKYGFFFSPQKCENKWRVLERKYKNLVMREMLKKPGRMKDYGHWEHKKALDEIFNEERKLVYLHESEYPSVSPASRYALLLPKVPSEQNSTASECETSQKVKSVPENSSKSSNITVNDSDSITIKNGEKSCKDPVQIYFDKFLMEVKKHFENAEKNKERRHMEKMEILKNKLQVQERLLKIKEQKLELEKTKILAMAQNINTYL